ncbi:MAG: polysaccharide biosynthesis/export family protein [Lentimicrobium sp.]|nr:polysaccharide biosynthesis/export family protein [Lentimicrobium sp.]
MKRLFLFILMLMLLGSCVSLRKVRYIQESAYGSMADSMVYQSMAPDYKIQPGDHLYVDVKNIDPKNMNPFQSNTNVNIQTSSEAGIYLNSYQVSEMGNIDFPLVGKVFVEGKTVFEIQNDLQDIINEFFQLTTVSVKLINFRISLLGEVLKPGTFMVYQNNLNIFQAISLGGDLTNYANRKEVRVIRKDRDGTRIHKVNLLSSEILNSPAYYLQPGDIVYVEPLSGKNFTFTAFPYAILFSTISTTLLIISFLK